MRVIRYNSYYSFGGSGAGAYVCGGRHCEEYRLVGIVV